MSCVRGGKGGKRPYLPTLIRPRSNTVPAELTMVTRVDDGLWKEDGQSRESVERKEETHLILNRRQTDGTVLLLVILLPFSGSSCTQGPAPLLLVFLVLIIEPGDPRLALSPCCPPRTACSALGYGLKCVVVLVLGVGVGGRRTLVIVERGAEVGGGSEGGGATAFGGRWGGRSVH